MNIQPLELLLSCYDTIEKQEQILLTYLPPETRNQLQNHTYVNINDIYLNEFVECISKKTGLHEYFGKIVKVSDPMITIRTKCRNISLSCDEYYIFHKHRKTKATTRKFYEDLLQSLNQI